MNYGPNEPKQVIIIRKDLNMRKGKMCSQASHASIGVIFNYMTPNYKNPEKMTREFTVKLPDGSTGESMYQWMTGIFKKIVVGAESLNEMVEAYNEAKKQGIPCSLIEDAGLTEFGGKVTITAVAIGPAYPEEIDPITGKFTLL